MTDNQHNLWHQIATPKLLKTIKPLSQSSSADIVVIGGGYSGLSTALHLAEAGVNVTLLEANEIGYGASGRNVGLTNAGLWIMPKQAEQLLGADLGRRLNQFLINAPKYVAELINRYDMDCDYVENGSLQLAHRKSSMKYLHERAKQMAEYGADVSILDQDMTYQLTKAEGYYGALKDARAGLIQPLKYCQALAKVALEKGVKIYSNSPVLGIEKTPSELILKTQNAKIKCEKLVLATNAYEVELNQNKTHYTPLYYCQLASNQLSESQRQQCLPAELGVWDTGAVMRSYRTDKQGRLIVGTVGNIHHKDATYFKQWSKHVVSKTFPNIGDLKYEFAWAGRIAKSHNNIPQLLETDGRIYQLLGYSGRGIAPATVGGKMLAEYMMGKINSNELPLPINQSTKISFNQLRSAIYEIGCQLSHLSDHLIR